MAIYPNPSAFPHYNNLNASPSQPISIEAWTEQATQSLNAVSLVSPSDAQSPSVTLAIGLDEQSNTKQVENTGSGGCAGDASRRREPMRRDSLKRRETLLKGKEGSRRRRQWENDRLLGNPWAQPPLPSDWEVHPTYPKHTVPYYLAPLWEQDIAVRAEAEKKKRDTLRKQAQAKHGSAGNIPRELRGKFKKAKAAKGLLKDLEEQVRLFVKSWEERTKPGSDHELDSEDEEIVFVGRNGQMHDMPSPPMNRVDDGDVERDRLVFDSLANDQGASFGRWLVHSLASYYGLRTWSITVGDPARREAYVGIPQDQANGRPASPTLLRPLYGLV